MYSYLFLTAKKYMNFDIKKFAKPISICIVIILAVSLSTPSKNIPPLYIVNMIADISINIDVITKYFFMIFTPFYTFVLYYSNKSKYLSDLHLKLSLYYIILSTRYVRINIARSDLMEIRRPLAYRARPKTLDEIVGQVVDIYKND